MTTTFFFPTWDDIVDTVGDVVNPDEGTPSPPPYEPEPTPEPTKLTDPVDPTLTPVEIINGKLDDIRLDVEYLRADVDITTELLVRGFSTFGDELTETFGSLDESFNSALADVELKIDSQVENLGDRVDRNLLRIDKIASRVEDNLVKLEELDGNNERRYERLSNKTDNLLNRVEDRFSQVDNLITQGFSRLETQTNFMLNRMEIRFDELSLDTSQGFLDVVSQLSNVESNLESGFLSAQDALFQVASESEIRDRSLDFKIDQLITSNEVLNGKVDDLIGMSQQLMQQNEDLATEMDLNFTETSKVIVDGLANLTQEIQYQFIDLNNSIDSQFQGTLDTIGNSTISIEDSIDSATTEIITSLSPGNSLSGQSQGSGGGLNGKF